MSTIQHSYLRSGAGKDTWKAPLRQPQGWKSETSVIAGSSSETFRGVKFAACLLHQSVESDRIAISSSIPEGSECSSFFLMPLLPDI